MVKSKKNRPKGIKRTTSKKSKIMYGGADIREKGLAVDIRDILKLLKDRGNSIPIDPRLTFPPDNINAYGLINQIIHNDDIDSTYGNKPELGDKYTSSEQARQIMQAVLDGMIRLPQDAFKQPENFEPSKRNIRFCLEKLRDLNKQIVQEDELAKVRDELQRKDAELDSINEEIETLKDEMQKNLAIQAQKNSEITAKNKKIAECEQELKRAKNSLELSMKEKQALQDSLRGKSAAAVKPSSPPTTSSASSSPSTASSSPTTASAVVLKPIAVKPTATTNANKSNMEKPKVYSSTPTMVASALNDIDKDEDDEKDLAPSAPPFDLAPKREQEEEKEKEKEAEVAEIFAHVDAIIKKELASGPDKEKAKCLNNFIKAVEINRDFKATLLDLALKESSSNIQKGKLNFDVFTQKVFDELCFYTKYAIDINKKSNYAEYISDKAKLAIKLIKVTDRDFSIFFNMIEYVIKYKAQKTTPEDRKTILRDYLQIFNLIKMDFEDLNSYKMKLMCGVNGSGYIRYLQCLILLIEKFKKLKIDKKLGNTERISEYFNTEKIKLIVKDKTKNIEYKLPPCILFQEIDYYFDDFALYRREFLKILAGIQHECSRAVADVLKEDTLISAIDHLKFLRSNIELNYVKFIFGCALSEADNEAFKSVSKSLEEYITGVKVFFDTTSAPDVVSVQKVKTDKEIEYFEELNKLNDACNNINKFVEPSSPESLKKAEEVDIKKSPEAQPEAQEKTEALTQEQTEEKNKIDATISKVISDYEINEGRQGREKARCLYNFIEKGARSLSENFRSRLLRLALDSSIIGGGEDIDFDKFMENVFDRLCFYTRDFAFINQSKEGYVAQKTRVFVNPLSIVTVFFEDFNEANKISKSLIGKSEEEINRILTEYDASTFGSLEYALEQPREFKTDYMCEDNGGGYYKYLWQLIAVIQQMPSIMKNYPPDKEGNITISDYFKEKLMNAKVGDMELPTCVWFDDIDRYTKISLEFEPKFQRMIQQTQQECSYNSSDVLKEANLEAKIETINSLISELDDNTIEFIFSCALNDEKLKLFTETYKILLRYFLNVKKSSSSSASALSGVQKKYVDDLDYLSKLFILITKFVNPVPTGEIVKAIEEMKINVEKEGGRKRSNKRSNRKTKKIRRFIKKVRKTKRKGKK
jgi:hypothetical protein